MKKNCILCKVGKVVARLLGNIIEMLLALSIYTCWILPLFDQGVDEKSDQIEKYMR